MATSTTSFTPRKHGFQFINRFSLDLKYELPLIGEIDLKDLIVGLCGGMCFAALDSYHAEIAISSRKTIPRAGSVMRNRLIQRQIQSLIPPFGILKVLRWTAEDDSYIWCRTTGIEFRKLRTRLDKGQPAVLALIRAERWENLEKNHQVIARAYHYDEQSGRLKIRIYDPNHPNKEPQISINVASPKTGINAKQSTGEPLRGFFVIDYKPELI